MVFSESLAPLEKARQIRQQKKKKKDCFLDFSANGDLSEQFSQEAQGLEGDSEWGKSVLKSQEVLQVSVSKSSCVKARAVLWTVSLS